MWGTRSAGVAAIGATSGAAAQEASDAGSVSSSRVVGPRYPITTGLNVSERNSRTMKFYRVWSKNGRAAFPILELDRVVAGGAVYLMVGRGHRRYAQTVDKDKARELLHRHHANGDTVELLDR